MACCYRVRLLCGCICSKHSKATTPWSSQPSDADHSSFGCDDERDLTYFGEAFLKDSVPTTRTIEEAFKKASALIDERETSEQKIHSNPQISVGAHMRDKLKGLESGAVRPPSHGTTTVFNH